MSRVRLYFKIARSTLLFYLKGCEVVPSRILSIQQGFYHQLKGLIDKKILPYLHKLENGDNTYKNQLVGSIIEMNRKFEDETDNILGSIPPNRKLVSLLLEERRLYRSAASRDFAAMADILHRLRETARQVFIDDCRQLGFSFDKLFREVIAGVLNDYREVIRRNNISVKSRISSGRNPVVIPFDDVAAWRDIMRNFIVNAVEACEGKNEGNAVRIEYKGASGSAGTVRITVADTGCGMDPETSANYYKRGFTRGKQSGTGFGIVEEYIDFINRQGVFDIKSESGRGTTVEIDIDPRKIGRAGRSELHYKKRDRVVKLSVLVILLVILFFAAGGDDYLFPPVPIEDNYIAGFTPEDPFGKGRLWEYGSVKIRTEANKERTIRFSPSAIKVAFEDSVGPVCYDVDRDGIDEMIAVILPPVEQRINLAGDIECYSPKGGLEWSVRVDKDIDLEGAEGFRAGGRATISQMMVIDTRGDEKFEIYVVANFPDGITKMMLLDSFGDVIQEYYHFGPAHIFEFTFVNLTDPEDPILAGKNILLENVPVLTRVDYEEGSYQSPPYPKNGIRPAKGPYYIMESVRESGIFNTGRWTSKLEAGFYNCFVIGKPQNMHVFQLNDGRLVISSLDLELVNQGYHQAKFEEWKRNNFFLRGDDMEIGEYLAATGRIYRWNDNHPKLISTYDPADTLTDLFRQCGIF
jgi:hypothetical protein